MSERIHDDEPDTSEATVRVLLGAECAQWADLPLEYLRTSGTDNAMWRVRTGSTNDVVVRLPRRPHAAAQVEREMELLVALASTPLTRTLRVPTVRHIGAPHEVFPYRWSVLDFVAGVDTWDARHSLGDLDVLAVDVAEAVLTIGGLTGLPAPPRPPGRRGGPIEPLIDALDRWLDDPQWQAARLVDVAAVRRLAEQAREVAGDPVTVGFTHGDLIPGNLLVAGGRLTGVIDWGGAGYGDSAQDLAPAWSVFDARSRAVFRAAIGADEAAWIRARTFELEHAVGGVVYYVPRGHTLGEVMQRTLARILDE